MAAADYRLLTEATGQRIAAAMEALSGTGAAAAAARANLDVYSKGETDTAIQQSTAKLKSKEIYGTTDSDGYINLGLSDYQIPVWATGASQSKILRFVCGMTSGSWGGFALCNAANTQVTFTCWYLNYSE